MSATQIVCPPDEQGWRWVRYDGGHHRGRAPPAAIRGFLAAAGLGQTSCRRRGVGAGPAVLRAGVAYEQKLDGHRALLFTPAGPRGTVVVQTRRGALVQDRWPDVVAAAEQLPPGLALDGELVVWDTPGGPVVV
ncbi:ATP dependent DNA ligase [Actinobacteria bacterium OV450]|nr:ATP dependent DNA ligase [Actinobacteria bacterium OV450]